MRTFAFTLLTLACVAANAQVYRCPAIEAGTGLTNAEIRVGTRNDAHALHGDVDPTDEGANIHVNLPREAPRWLACQYGGQQVGATVISGPRAIGARELWIKLEPTITACTLVIRKAVPQGKEPPSWSAVATCEREQPPPPDLV